MKMVSVPNVSLLFVGWLTLQLSGFRARENIQEKQIQTGNQACQILIHLFYFCFAIRAISFFS